MNMCLLYRIKQLIPQRSKVSSRAFKFVCKISNLLWFDNLCNGCQNDLTQSWKFSEKNCHSSFLLKNDYVTSYLIMDSLRFLNSIFLKLRQKTNETNTAGSTSTDSLPVTLRLGGLLTPNFNKTMVQRKSTKNTIGKAFICLQCIRLEANSKKIQKLCKTKSKLSISKLASFCIIDGIKFSNHFFGNIH